jgi:hypothetical protein
VQADFLNKNKGASEAFGGGCGRVSATVTLPSMALSPAEKQQRYRDKLKAKEQTNSDAIEQALLQEAERVGEMSAEERNALANKLADLAMSTLHRAQQLAAVARKLRIAD